MNPAPGSSISTSPEAVAALMRPRAVAVIGASRRPQAVGHCVVQNLLEGGYRGAVYPINPSAQEIAGLRCSPNLAAVGAPVDLAIVAVPAPIVLDVVSEAADHGVKAIVILSAGFSEVGGTGIHRQERLSALARQRGLALVGPNCLGLINTAAEVRLNASFATRMPLAGPVALLSQSGALTTALLDHAADRSMGFSTIVSFGNRAGLTEVELLQIAAADPHTRCILLYLEDLADGGDFLAAAERVSHGPDAKPIIVLHAGRTSAGARAAASHTGALAGAAALYDGLFDQAGVLRIPDVAALFDAAEIFADSRRGAGGRTLIVTNAGGPAIIAADACVETGLPLATLSDTSIDAVRKSLPPAATTGNPLDLIGDAPPDRFESAISAGVADAGVDQLLVILTPQRATDVGAIADTVGRLSRQSDKPAAACFMGGPDVAAGVAALRKVWGVPCFAFPENAVRAMAAKARFSAESHRRLLAIVELADVDAAAARRIVDRELSAGRLWLVEARALELLAHYRLAVMPWRLAADEESAVRAAAELGFPVAVKLASPDVLHKTELGGVHLGLTGEPQVRNAFRAIVAAFHGRQKPGTLWGAVVQKMAPPGRELIIGMRRDGRLGPMVMVGLGGIWAEIWRDVAFRRAPLREGEPMRMFEQLRSLPLLHGARGAAPVDFGLLSAMVHRVAQLATDEPRICELDLNPVIAGPAPGNIHIIDARIVLGRP